MEKEDEVEEARVCEKVPEEEDEQEEAEEAEKACKKLQEEGGEVEVRGERGREM